MDAFDCPHLRFEGDVSEVNTDGFATEHQRGLLISDRDIHIWRANLDLPITRIKKYHQMLSNDEGVRAERFRFEQDRHRFIVRRGKLRAILGRYLGIAPNRLQFCCREYGKLALVDGIGNGSIRFSVSHSDGLALYGFARGHEIGVDVERIRDISEMEEIIEAFFSTNEKALFHGLPEREKRKAFFNGWTRKEAFIKAFGTGLSYPLDSFDVGLASDGADKLRTFDAERREVCDWTIHALTPGHDYMGAFAINRKDFTLRCFGWTAVTSN